MCFALKAQEVNGKVTYKVIRHIDKNDIKENLLKSTFNNYKDISEEFEFSLIFNKEAAVFFMIDKLYSNQVSAMITKVNTNYFGRIAYHKDYYLEESLEEDFGKFLVKRLYQNWTLHEHTKLIGDNLCFKATTSYKVTNPKGKEVTYNFTAWYAPQLPFKYGPLGYGNLPGLILELQAENYTYGVSKIEFSKDENKFKMPKLKKLKLITEKEFESLAAIEEKRWRKKNN